MTTLFLLAGIALPLPLLLLFYRCRTKGLSKVLFWVGILLFFAWLLPLLEFYIKTPLEEPAAASKTPNPSKGWLNKSGASTYLVYLDVYGLPWIGLFAPFLWCLGGALLIRATLSKSDFSGGRKFSFIISSLMFASVFVFLILFYFYIDKESGQRGWGFFGPENYWEVNED